MSMARKQVATNSFAKTDRKERKALLHQPVTPALVCPDCILWQYLPEFLDVGPDTVVADAGILPDIFYDLFQNIDSHNNELAPAMHWAKTILIHHAYINRPFG